jgi:hypothetical protein
MNMRVLINLPMLKPSAGTQVTLIAEPERLIPIQSQNMILEKEIFSADGSNNIK